MKKNEINSNGLSSNSLSYLSKNCLSKLASVLPCDHFFKLHTLPNNSSYIINLDNSQYSGSHYVAVIVKKEYVWYFDSIGLPLGLSMNSNILNRLKRTRKDILWSKKSIQGINSLFCGFYCISFLVKCAHEKVKYKVFVRLYKGRRYAKNEKVCKNILKKALVKADWMLEVKKVVYVSVKKCKAKNGAALEREKKDTGAS